MNGYLKRGIMMRRSDKVILVGLGVISILALVGYVVNIIWQTAYHPPIIRNATLTVTTPVARIGDVVLYEVEQIKYRNVEAKVVREIVGADGQKFWCSPNLSGTAGVGYSITKTNIIVPENTTPQWYRLKLTRTYPPLNSYQSETTLPPLYSVNWFYVTVP